MDCVSGQRIKGASEGDGGLPFLLISSEMFPHLACDSVAASRVERQDCMGDTLLEITRNRSQDSNAGPKALSYEQDAFQSILE